MSYVMGLYHQLINHRGLQPRFFKIGKAKRMWKKFPYLVYAELISGKIGAFKMKLFGKEKFILAYAQTNDMKIQWLVSATSVKEPKEQHKLQLRVRQEKCVESKAKLAQNICSLNTILSHYSCLVSPLNLSSHFPDNMETPRKEESSESDNETLAIIQQNNDKGEEKNGNNEGKRPVANNEKEQEEGKQSINKGQPVKQNKGANREIKPEINKEADEKQSVKEEKQPIKQNKSKEEKQPVKQSNNEKQSVKVEKNLNEISTQNATSTSTNAKTGLKKIQAQANAKASMKRIQAQYGEPQLPDPYENDVNARNAKIHAQYDEPQFPDPEEQTTYHKPKIVKRQTQKKPVSYIKKKPIGSPTYN